MNRINIYIWLLALSLVLAIIFQEILTSRAGSECNKDIPQNAGDICPVMIGEILPELILKSVDSKPFDLNKAVAEKETVLIFYRGGWCPYCNTHLGKLQTIESELLKLGFQIIAVSPDRPELLKSKAEKRGLNYRLLSDSDMNASKSLGIAFRLDDETFNKYKNSYGIDIEADSGYKHHLLPVPAVFILDTDGVIKFSYINPNYKVRIDPEVLISAAKAVKKEGDN